MIQQVLLPTLVGSWKSATVGYTTAVLVYRYGTLTEIGKVLSRLAMIRLTWKGVARSVKTWAILSDMLGARMAGGMVVVCWCCLLAPPRVQLASVETTDHDRILHGKPLSDEVNTTTTVFQYFSQTGKYRSRHFGSAASFNFSLRIWLNNNIPVNNYLNSRQ